MYVVGQDQRVALEMQSTEGAKSALKDWAVRGGAGEPGRDEGILPRPYIRVISGMGANP